MIGGNDTVQEGRQNNEHGQLNERELYLRYGVLDSEIKVIKKMFSNLMKTFYVDDLDIIQISFCIARKLIL